MNTSALINLLEHYQDIIAELKEERDALRLRVIDLQEQLMYKPPAISGTTYTPASWTTWTSVCNCHLYENNKLTGGWYCPTHGQQF